MLDKRVSLKLTCTDTGPYVIFVFKLMLCNFASDMHVQGTPGRYTAQDAYCSLCSWCCGLLCGLCSWCHFFFCVYLKEENIKNAKFKTHTESTKSETKWLLTTDVFQGFILGCGVSPYVHCAVSKALQLCTVCCLIGSLLTCLSVVFS